MKGSIRQRIKGSWEICIDVGRDSATGKRLRHFESVKGAKKEAQRKVTRERNGKTQAQKVEKVYREILGC